jgi:hypothetical protein
VKDTQLLRLHVEEDIWTAILKWSQEEHLRTCAAVKLPHQVHGCRQGNVLLPEV